METARSDPAPEQAEAVKSDAQTTPIQNGEATTTPATAGAKDTKSAKKVKKGKSKHKGKHHKHKSSKSKKEEESDSDSSSDSSSDSDLSDSSDSESSSSEDEKAKKKKKKKEKAKKKAAALKKKAKKSKKSQRRKDDSSDSDSSDSDSDSSSEEETTRKKRKKKSRKSRDDDSKDEDSSTQTTHDEAPAASTDPPAAAPADATTTVTMASILTELQKLVANQTATTTQTTPPAGLQVRAIRGRRGRRIKAGGLDPDELKPKSGKPEYKRVDQLWDSNIHDYKLTETAESQPDEFDGYVSILVAVVLYHITNVPQVFHVRRRFDWENKYRNTVVDIKSHFLRDALQEIMKDVKAVSLVENQPTIDPNMLFLYVEEMRKFHKKTLKARIKKEKKKKAIKRLKTMRTHLKLMIGYIDKDFDEKKKAIFPMIKAGNITFEYLWALFKPNTLAFTTTYGASDHPRCFKVDFAYAEKNYMRGEYYVIEGRYLDYDGKNFGLGDFELQIDHFKGPRKITSLVTYPIEFHKDPEGLKKQLLDRGKQFVNLAGMNFKYMKGLAFQKRKKQVLKFNINGRVMVDPKTFRRINANYQVSGVKDDRNEDDDSDSDECSECGCESDGDDGADGSLSDNDAEASKPRYRVVWDDDNKPHIVQIKDDDDEPQQKSLDQLPNGDNTEEDAKDGTKDGVEKAKSRDFTEEELIIASPVVLGFSFTEKSWFEFAVSGVSDIVWNENAFETLVLPKDHKELVKAQVKSHKFHAAETIDDVIQGKGKGLVFVLHGPPGVGKTLTAEGIAEFLKCPLYAVSAGDLGTDARTLEHELNKIMDIAHSWGAVLLLDEADVFLEKRQHQDVHRNALVSIFLRLLEYFQGILFLTTNRVETFDEAFQSRIHIALKYSELGVRAKKDIWKSFISMVRQGGGAADQLTNGDYDELARHNLNGRQVCLQFLGLLSSFANCIFLRSRIW
jgi:uncharacterized protein DUF7025/ATPase family protein associated with various cellular activities (AAA)